MPFVIPRYSLLKVADYQALFVPDSEGERNLNEATALLINYLPVIGVPELTEDRAEDAWLRIAAHQAQLGTPVEGLKGERLYLTRLDVIRHVGLRTEGDNKSIESFWQYLSRRRPESELDLPFVCANNGHTLLSLFGVDGAMPPESGA